MPAEDPGPGPYYVAYLLINSFERTAPGRLDKKAVSKMADPYLLEVAKALRILLAARGVEESEVPTGDRDLYRYFVDQGWLNADIRAHWKDSGPLTRGLAYALVVETLSQLGVLQKAN